jgi:hypothetical protein
MAWHTYLFKKFLVSNCTDLFKHALPADRTEILVRDYLLIKCGIVCVVDLLAYSADALGHDPNPAFFIFDPQFGQEIWRCFVPQLMQ